MSVWTTFRDNAINRKIVINWTEDEFYYHITAADGALVFGCDLEKNNHNDDLIDFETNYKKIIKRYEQRHYATVSVASSDSNEYVPPAGTKIHITEIGGSGASSTSTKIEIFWNNELIMSTHGDSSQSSSYCCEGDGEKILKIVLTNSSLSSQSLGGYIFGQTCEAIAS